MHLSRAQDACRRPWEHFDTRSALTYASERCEANQHPHLVGVGYAILRSPGRRMLADLRTDRVELGSPREQPGTPGKSRLASPPC